MRIESPQIRNFINGEFVEPIGGRYLDNIEPATGKPYSEVADSDAHDVDLAVAAAEKAFPDWSRKSASERSSLLLRIAELIERDLDRYRQADFTGAFVGYSARGGKLPILCDGDPAHRIGSASHRQRRV
jgi:hypothetical protein